MKSRTRSLFVALLAISATLLAPRGAEAKKKTDQFNVIPIQVTDVRLVENEVVADIRIGNVTQTVPVTNIQVRPGAAAMAQAPGERPAVILASNGPVQVAQVVTCPILHLELEIDRLDLLGLVVELDDCAEGPVTVDVSAVPGGGLLGDLLCGLLGGLDIDLPLNLGDLLAQLTPAQLNRLLDIIQTILNGILQRATASTTLANSTAQVNDTCTILDLALGPINLNLLGLLVETSDICLSITAEEGGGLLGDLLCNVANLLNGNANDNAVFNALRRLARAIERATGG